MKVEAVINDIKREFVELCGGIECEDCELRVSPACCVWYTFRYLENHGMVRKRYIGHENGICNKYYNKVNKPENINFRVAYATDIVLHFVTWLKENGYLKGVE